MAQVIPTPLIGPPDVPIIGDWLGKIGRIKMINAQACQPNGYVAAYAIWHATPFIIWSLFAPDCIDLVDDRRGGGHRRHRRYRWKNANLLGAESAPSGGAGLAVWRLGDLAQRAGWYMGIIDATLDFIVYSSSMAYQFSGCSGSGTLYSGHDTGGQPQNLLLANQWIPLNWVHTEQGGLATGVNDVVVPAGDTWASMLQFQATPAPPPFAPVTDFRMRIVQAGTENVVQQIDGDDDGTGTFNGYGFAQDHFNFLGIRLQSQYFADNPCFCFGNWQVSSIETSDGSFIPYGCGHSKETVHVKDVKDWWNKWFT